MSKIHDGSKIREYLDRYMEGVKKRNPGQPEFVQAVYEVASSIFPYIADKPQYHESQILERMAEPERVISFRVPWTDDKGNIRTNRDGAFNSTRQLVPTRAGFAFTPSKMNLF